MDPIDKLVRLYMNKVVRLHGVPVSIISYHGPQFSSHIWPNIQDALGTRLSLNIAFHSKINDQLKRTIHTLKDLLRACVLEFRDNWENHLPLMEFTYNNSYQATIRITRYKALYGQRCCTLLR